MLTVFIRKTICNKNVAYYDSSHNIMLAKVCIKLDNNIPSCNFRWMLLAIVQLS